MSTTTSLLGYNFWDGGFMSARLSKTTQFHYGIVHTYVADYKVLEVPLIIKKHLKTDFQAFFCGRINSTINADSTLDQFSENTGPTLGASFELGLPYDVNKNFMLEMRYSLPADKNKKVYPVEME